MNEKVINQGSPIKDTVQVANDIKNLIKNVDWLQKVFEEHGFEKCDTIAINRLITDDGYIVEMLEQSGVYEFWITHKNCGVKDYMFGLPIEQQSAKEAIAIMLNNVDTYINTYKEKYVDKD